MKTILSFPIALALLHAAGVGLGAEAPVRLNDLVVNPNSKDSPVARIKASIPETRNLDLLGDISRLLAMGEARLCPRLYSDFADALGSRDAVLEAALNHPLPTAIAPGAK